jgi:hypothetical protein
MSHLNIGCPVGILRLVGRKREKVNKDLAYTSCVKGKFIGLPQRTALLLLSLLVPPV